MAETRREKILRDIAKWPEHARIGFDAVESGESYSSFQARLLAAIAGPRATAGLEVGPSGYQDFRAVVPDLIALRGAGRIVGTMPESERTRRSRAAEEAWSYCRSRDGSIFKGMAERLTHNAKDALGNRDFWARAMSGSSQFPDALRDSFSNLLLGYYTETERTFEQITTPISVPDFKPSSLFRVDLPNLLLTGELVPAPNTVPEDARGQNIQLGSYQQSVSLSRQVIINDDTQGLAATAQGAALAAARTVADAVYALILANPTIPETSAALFSSTNGNTATATLDSDGLSSVIALIRAQKGPGGATLNQRPATLLVAPGAEGKARKVLGDWGSAASLNVVVEPRLTPSTTFYVIARGNGIVIGYLQGRSTPSVSPVGGDNPLGMTWVINLDFAVAAVDFRPLSRGV